LTHENQQAGVNPGGDIGDPGHTPAAGAPNSVENPELSIAGYGPPDISGPGRKSIPFFKKPSSVVLFAANKTFTDFTVEKAGPYHFSFTIRIRHHLVAARRLHPGLRVASRAEFLLHFIQHWVSKRYTAGCRIRHPGLDPGPA
jgi:hypothetical protein